MGRPHNLSRQRGKKKILTLLGFELRTSIVQTVACPYTDCAIPGEENTDGNEQQNSVIENNGDCKTESADVKINLAMGGWTVNPVTENDPNLKRSTKVKNVFTV